MFLNGVLEAPKRVSKRPLAHRSAKVPVVWGAGRILMVYVADLHAENPRKTRF